MNEDHTDAPAPAALQGITEQDYLLWRHHPVTRLLLSYLRDYRADLVLAAQERWLAGELALATEHEMKGRVNSLAELADLPFAAIATFYRQLAQAEEEQDAAQAD
jgi:hypothetical protein